MTMDERDETVTKGEVVDLTGAVRELASKFKWQQRLTLGLLAAVVGVALALALGATALVQVRHENQCIAGLAAASADRTGALAPLSTARTLAQDAQQDAQTALLFHAITTFGDTPKVRATTLGTDVQAFKTAHENYVNANQAYQQAYAANPPPRVPSFHC